jgi:DnaK suppressor protein
LLRPGAESTARRARIILSPVMNDERARKALLAARDELLALSEQSAESRQAVTLDQQSVGRLSRMDAMQGQAMAQAAEQRRAAELARIGAALQRIDDGTYGDCLRCGEPIAEKRLEIDPAATLCVDCARDR